MRHHNLVSSKRSSAACSRMTFSILGPREWPNGQCFFGCIIGSLFETVEYPGCAGHLLIFPRFQVNGSLTANVSQDLISTISDPEHPHTLGQLSVINLPDIHLEPPPSETGVVSTDTLVRVLVDITPTITHCSLATVIGLAVRVRLERTLPPNYRIDVRIKAGSHSDDDAVTKQLGDKERVAAALENSTLRGMLDTMMATCTR